MYCPSREWIDRIVSAISLTVEERNLLLAQAGRLDKELEALALVAQARPEIKELMLLAVTLTERRIKQLISKIHSHVFDTIEKLETERIESLTDEELAQELIEQGIDPVEVVEAGMAVVNKYRKQHGQEAI